MKKKLNLEVQELREEITDKLRKIKQRQKVERKIKFKS